VTLHRDLATSGAYVPAETGPELDLAGALGAPADPPTAAPPGLPPAPPEPEPQGKPKRRRHVVLDVCIVLGVVMAYCLSLLGYHLLASEPRMPEPELSTADGTVVLVRLEQLHTVANRLDVKVLVMPDDSLLNKRLNVLSTDTSVRFFPQNDLGDLQYPVGKLPAQVSTTIEAHGDPGDWPFDSYTTDLIQADVLVGSGDNRQYTFGRVEVTGSLEGWDVELTRVARNKNDPDRPDNVIITLHRARGPLVFDLGICLVLITLPTLALFVAIQMLTGRRQFLPPFATWYAAMLFAVVPLRNILPGAPPPGSWIDQAVVIWVLIGLAAALVLYIIAWYRNSS
ncbi:DUF4436 domain-containing protein, partial [Mycobacterium numidiamassiliense]